RLRPKKIGHAFPTGDLFRRARVRLESGDDAFVERFLSRHFKSTTPMPPMPQMPQLVQSSQSQPLKEHFRIDDRDDRVGMSGAPDCFELGPLPKAAPPPRLRWSVALEHVEQPRSTRDSDAEVSARFVVCEGVLLNRRMKDQQTREEKGEGEGEELRPCRSQ